MKFTDLKCCPFCGHDTYYTKNYTYGVVNFNCHFDGSEADNSYMYDNLVTKESNGYVYCAYCNKRLGNMILNSVSKQVQKSLNKLNK